MNNRNSIYWCLLHIPILVLSDRPNRPIYPISTRSSSSLSRRLCASALGSARLSIDCFVVPTPADFTPVQVRLVAEIYDLTEGELRHIRVERDPSSCFSKHRTTALFAFVHNRSAWLKFVSGRRLKRGYVGTLRRQTENFSVSDC